MRVDLREGVGDCETSDALPRVEVIVDESVRRVLAGAAVHQLRLLVSVQSVVPRGRRPRASEAGDQFEQAVSAYVAENAPSYAHLDPTQAGLALQVALLEAFDVPMGDKAIAIFMHAAWTPEHSRIHGVAAHPMSLRRLRAELRRRKRREPRTRRCRTAVQLPRE